MTSQRNREPADVRAAMDEIRAVPEGSDRRSITLVSGGGMRVVLLRLRAGASLPAHATSGPTTIHALEGRVTVDIEGSTNALRAGGLVALDAGEQHGVSAQEDSTLLLTVGTPAG